MDISTELIEQLLYEDEGPALDFRQAQYPFRKASSSKKAELLKDILAFANSWRRSDAFILIGVREIRGGRSEPLGVELHLDDADLQQFVNSKTQRPLQFSYRAVAVDDLPIGVLRIPQQERPIYLKRPYGTLEAEVVYLRRGSSTARASPDEIARMGRTEVSEDRGVPQLEFELAQFGGRATLGCAAEATVEVLEPIEAPDYSPTDDSLSRAFNNIDYLRELVEYVRLQRLTTNFGLVVHNRGEQHAKKVEWRAKLAQNDACFILGSNDIPDKPSPINFAGSLADQMRSIVHAPSLSVSGFTDHWEIRARFGDVLPGDSVFLMEPLVVGAIASGSIVIEGQLFAANLPKPKTADLQIALRASTRLMTPEDLVAYHDD